MYIYICIAIVAIVCNNNNYYRPPSVYCFELLRKLHRQYIWLTKKSNKIEIILSVVPMITAAVI